MLILEPSCLPSFLSLKCDSHHRSGGIERIHYHLALTIYCDLLSSRFGNVADLLPTSRVYIALHLEQPALSLTLFLIQLNIFQDSWRLLVPVSTYTKAKEAKRDGCWIPLNIKGSPYAVEGKMFRLR